MEKLTQHIEYLLLRHDCVVVPGVGAFINFRESARYDSDTAIWYPMRREVRFNGSLTHSDGLLANSYARRERVTFQEGKEMLLRDTARLTEALDRDGEATLGKLGILIKEEGVVQYKPNNLYTSSSQWLGLVPVSMHSAFAAQKDSDTLPTTPAAAHISGNSGKDPVKEDREGDMSVAGTDTVKRRFDTARNYYIPVNKVFAKVAASFLLVIAVALAVMLPVSSRMQEDRASVVPTQNIERHIPATGETEKAEKSKVVTPVAQTKSAAAPAASKVNTATAVEPNAKNSVDASSSARYQLIVATFRTRAEADKFISLHAGSTYKLMPIESKTMCRVSAWGADESSSLREILNAGTFQNEYREAWIWENKSAN